MTATAARQGWVRQHRAVIENDRGKVRPYPIEAPVEGGRGLP
ncbi:hypothetical protein THTE_1215 [Thermogutta terrifontis]|uniref:Uncharacterized protein n=1 Tax=Thermogutta terrifontis TaxID=1331910 RepID=A0A286RD12_9BACT|nr:hypothetical protein THTE_1215 [Thermogutta terrifontis]